MVHLSPQLLSMDEQTGAINLQPKPTQNLMSEAEADTETIISANLEWSAKAIVE